MGKNGGADCRATYCRIKLQMENSNHFLRPIISQRCVSLMSPNRASCRRSKADRRQVSNFATHFRSCVRFSSSALAPAFSPALCCRSRPRRLVSVRPIAAQNEGAQYSNPLRARGYARSCRRLRRRRVVLPVDPTWNVSPFPRFRSVRPGVARVKRGKAWKRVGVRRGCRERVERACGRDERVRRCLLQRRSTGHKRSVQGVRGCAGGTPRRGQLDLN